jgi:hypothetical protein
MADGMAINVSQEEHLMSKRLLQEYLTPRLAKTIVESTEDGNGKKSLYMKGIFIQGDVRNANERVYPVNEISNAVKTMKQMILETGGILGEVDHPDDLKINLDRVSHTIVDIDMDGPNGVGKLKILPTPMGQLISTMLESGVKLGVSSRGSGNVDDATGKVSDFEIVTVDIVAQPSAPNAYPKAIYEGLMNMRHGHRVIDNLKGANLDKDAAVQKFLKEEVTRLIKDLKI